MVQAALQLALDAHVGQTRDGRDGEWRRPYFVHPVQVAAKLSEWGAADETLFSAAMLHDVLEDTSVSAQTIRQQFGEAVLRLVEELSCSADRDKVEYMRSFESASVEAFVIKLADRWCNVSDFCVEEPKYAPKYLRKAAPLFEFFQRRQSEIEARFGAAVWQRIREDLASLCRRVDLHEGPFGL
ncbi:MAG: HD domain-containing protein [Planctomycetaceae bacterium]